MISRIAELSLQRVGCYPEWQQPISLMNFVGGYFLKPLEQEKLEVRKNVPKPRRIPSVQCKVLATSSPRRSRAGSSRTLCWAAFCAGNLNFGKTFSSAQCCYHWIYLNKAYHHSLISL